MIAALLLLFLLAAEVAPAPACHPVEGERLTARDLAAADPALASLPEAAELGYAPAPGVRRVVRAAELSRLAVRFGLPGEGLSDLCFERVARLLDRAELLAAMQAALRIPDAHIEIVDIMRYPVPSGSLEFSRSGLGTPPPATPAIAVLWRGYVLTAGKRRFPVWARVKIEARLNRVIAVVDLRPGAPVAAGQVRLDAITGFPDPHSASGTLEEIIGRSLVRFVRAGAAIPLAALESRDQAPAADITRGDRVNVSVQEGGAHLQFEARAEAQGHLGQTIPVRNIASGKSFRAQVTGKGKVSVGDAPQP